MAATLRAASSGQGGSTAVATVTPTLPTGATTGDIVYALVTTGTTFASPATSWTVTSGWTLLDGSTGLANSGGQTHGTNVAYKVLAGGDTAPVFSWTNTCKVAWVVVAFTPDAGETVAHDSSATPVVNTVAATTHTPPALTVGSTGVSVILTGSRANASGATAVTTTPPTNWTEPTNGDNSTAVGTTNATRQVAASLSYQLAQTGTISPGSETVTGGSAGGSTCANVYHVLLTSAGGGTVTVQKPTPRNRARFRASFY